MEYDIIDVINKEHEEISKLKMQIAKWEATEEQLLLVQIQFQKEIDRILSYNSKHDIC